MRGGPPRRRRGSAPLAVCQLGAQILELFQAGGGVGVARGCSQRAPGDGGRRGRREQAESLKRPWGEGRCSHALDLHEARLQLPFQPLCRHSNRRLRISLRTLPHCEAKEQPRTADGGSCGRSFALLRLRRLSGDGETHRGPTCSTRRRKSGSAPSTGVARAGLAVVAQRPRAPRQA